MRQRKNLIGLFAILLAISASAFTTITKHRAESKFTSYYWFLVDQYGNTIPSSTAPSSQQKSDNPFGCPNSGPTLCARGYSSYQYDAPSQKYVPVGTMQDYTNKQNE